MNRVAVINVVGLTPSLIGAWTPGIQKFVESGWAVPLEEPFPAVTCTSQVQMLTGTEPREHGIVGNGWYSRDSAEVGFWKQSNGLVLTEEIYDAMKRRDPSFTCAKVFWWFNMYSGADWSVTPRPHYPADGKKVFDVYTRPMDMGAAMVEELGPFPFQRFWGPGSGIQSSKWISLSAQWIYERHRPTLSLVYLPHLDYPLQKLGTSSPELQDELLAIDDVVSELIHFYENHDVRVMLVSEYGITDVKRHVHPNRILREAGMITVRPSLGFELLEPGECDAFAVSDHQIAHVYVKDPSRIPDVVKLFEGTQGTRRVLHGDAIAEAGLDHERSGDVILMADPDCWYTYYYWLDDDKAPDFARCVDIHRKPGYDPVELFLDPDIKVPKLRIGWTLLKKILGFRYLMNVIPLRPELVRGSHGTPVLDRAHGPLVASRTTELRPDAATLPMTAVRELIERHLGS